MKKTFQITLKDNKRLIFDFSNLLNFRILNNFILFPKLNIIE